MPQTFLQCPFGQIRVTWAGTTLVGIELDPDAQPADRAGGQPPAQDALPAVVAEQLSGYFADPKASFDLSLDMRGTPFQRRVWDAIRAIPSGQARTYGELAKDLSSAARAVGQACRANPCPIVVPCHRVVGTQGLGGFAGDTSGRLMQVKRWLLAHEGWLKPGVMRDEHARRSRHH